MNIMLLLLQVTFSIAVFSPSKTSTNAQFSDNFHLVSCNKIHIKPIDEAIERDFSDAWKFRRYFLKLQSRTQPLFASFVFETLIPETSKFLNSQKSTKEPFIIVCVFFSGCEDSLEWSGPNLQYFENAFEGSIVDTQCDMLMARVPVRCITSTRAAVIAFHQSTNGKHVAALEHGLNMAYEFRPGDEKRVHIWKRLP